MAEIRIHESQQADLSSNFKPKFTLAELLVVIAIFAVVASIIWPTTRNRGDNARADSCQSNLKQIGMAFAQYQADNDNFFPKATLSGKSGWVDVLLVYTRERQVFECPSAGTHLQGKTDYFFNARLSKRNSSEVNDPISTITSGDGKSNSPTNYSISALPWEWIADNPSPAKRHQDLANYLFADGHVKRSDFWKVENVTGNLARYYFSIR